MAKKQIFISVCCFLSLFQLVSSGMCAEDSMGNYTQNVSISTTALHEWMPSVTYNSIENEFLVLWHSTGIREEGGVNKYSLHGQRFDPQGNPLGDTLSPIQSIGPERRLLPRAAHNPFTNEYMVSFIMGQEVTEWDPFVTKLDNKGAITLDAFPLSEQLTKANHANIVFNSTRRQYLVVYNDSRNGAADIFGVILGEDGTVVKQDFLINGVQGEQINAYASYNSVDDTYLINWEDFRNVTTWQEPGDIYGALLDGEGAVIKNDIAMCDDYGTENAGDQRVQSIAYNPDNNEFLASWWDSRPSLDNEAVVGRIIKADGTPSGADFVIADAPNSQSFPHILYIQERGMYFAVWDDKRNDDADSYWAEAKNRDIYAQWLSPSGGPVGEDIPICIKEGNQRYSEVAYSPLMDRFFVVWRDEIDEQVFSGGSGHITESGGNMMGMVYGTPSFLTGRIIEQGTNAPVENTTVIIIGAGTPVKKTTNIGGWFNIPEAGQKNGTYFLIAYKGGYGFTFTSAEYAGEPLTINMEMKKR
jgi:hypothetical protein